MRRDDTTTTEYQRTFRGRHSIGTGVWSYPGHDGRKFKLGTRYLRCACGWRLIEIGRTERSKRAAADRHRAHVAEIKAAVP